MDTDDDLPPPPQQVPQRTIELDDSDDDLPPPPPRQPVEVVLDDDDDLDVAPPPPPASAAATSSAAVVVPADFDDDLPPPPPKQQTAAPPTVAAAPSPVAAASPPPTEEVPPPAASRPRSTGVVEPSAPTPTTAPVSNDSIASAAGSGAAARTRSNTVAKQKLFKEGYLLKQQPTWPYTAQKRWCVLANRQLSYFESKESASGKASGTLDLRNAHLRTTDIGTDRPHSFGVQMAVDPHANVAIGFGSKVLGIGGGAPPGGASSSSTSGGSGGGGGGGRTYVFSALNSEEFGQWTTVLESVCANGNVQTELHWFEKLAQGTF